MVHGSFVEDARKVVEQLRKAVVGDTVKKAIIVPHVTRKRDESLTTDRWVKVYEGTPQPAKYLYEFAGLRAPRSSNDLVAEALEKVHAGGGQRNLQSLSTALQENPSYAAIARAEVMIDEVSISIPLRHLQERVHFLRLPSGQKAVLFVGETVSVHLEGRDLMAAKFVKFATKSLIEDL